MSQVNQKKELDLILFDYKLVEQKFDFIKDAVLKQNILLYANYFLMIYTLGQSHELPGKLKHTNNKIIIILIAQIAEALAQYLIGLGMETGVLADDCLGEDWKTLPGNKTIKLPDIVSNLLPDSFDPANIKVSMKFEHKVNREFRNDISFQEVVNCLKRSTNTPVLTNDLSYLQRLRNRIHIGGLSQTDDVYEDKDVNTVLEKLGTIVTAVSGLLNKWGV